jgi:two-component system LytT family response regulator
MDGARPLVRRPLKYFEERLNPSHFFRVNRRQIVGLGMVKATRPVENGGIELDLGDATKLEVSRRQARAFKEAFRI